MAVTRPVPTGSGFVFVVFPAHSPFWAKRGRHGGHIRVIERKRPAWRGRRLWSALVGVALYRGVLSSSLKARSVCSNISWSRSRVMKTRRERRSESGQASNRTGGWKTC